MWIFWSSLTNSEFEADGKNNLACLERPASKEDKAASKNEIQ